MTTLCFLTHQDIFDRSVGHLFERERAALLLGGERVRRGYFGSCPVGQFVEPRDYVRAIDGVPVRFIGKPAVEVPRYMNMGVAALKRALLRARINVYDPAAIALLSCLQNVHDAFCVRDWREHLQSIAREFDLKSDLLRSVA
jgi:hypothetical protein